MSRERFQVDTDLLRKSSCDLQKYLHDMKSARQNLETELEKLNKVWTGPAQKTFYGQFADRIKRLDQLYVKLGEIINSMEEAAKAYDYYDGKVKGIVDAIRV